MILRLLLFIHIILCTKTSGLGTHKKGPLTTIQSPDGDIIDCFNAREQPVFDHPLMRDHKFQETPKTLPEMMKATTKKRKWQQVWNTNGKSCPEKTVAIRRAGRTAGVSRGTIPYPTEEGHEYALAYTGYQNGIYGSSATMSVWDPVVEQGTGEFSLAQIWLVAGLYEQGDLNSVEAGWQVFPENYHDNQPRFFASWTRDAYQKTGCLNMECDGFVQVSLDFAVGSAISPVSSYGANQFELAVHIWKDTDDGNWWLGVGTSLVGYWPSNLFTHLANGPANLVMWGGEVVNTRTYGRHTTTQMGSGHFAEEGPGKASFFHHLRIVDYLYHYIPVEEFLLTNFNSSCYNIVKVRSEERGTHFYYGGPGFNDKCQ